MRLNIRQAMAITVLFVIINTLKVSWIQCSLLSEATWETFVYKMIVTGCVNAALLLYFFGFQSAFLLVTYYCIQTAYLSANLLYYAFFHSYIHLPVAMSMLSEFGSAADSLVIIKPMTLLSMVLDFPLLISSLVASKNRFSISAFAKKSLYITALLVLVAIESITYLKGKALYLPVHRQGVSESEIVKHYGLFINEITTLLKYGSETKVIRTLVPGPATTILSENDSSTSICVVQVESLSSTIVNSVHNGKPIMPFVSSLRDSTIYAPFMVSYHYAGGTSDCEFAAINSIIPPKAFPACKLISYNYPNSFIPILKSYGYECFTFHGNHKNYFNREINFSKMKFDRFFDMQRMGLSSFGWGASDSAVFSYVLEYEKKARKPYLYYVITMSSHPPYTNCLLYSDSNMYDDIKDRGLRNYYTSMQYVDRQLSQFTYALKNQNPNICIIIFGDHVEAVGSPEMVPSIKNINGIAIETVPFFLIAPNKKPHVISLAVSMLDLAPTILDAAGCSVLYNTHGESLISNRFGVQPVYLTQANAINRKQAYVKMILTK